MRWLPALAVVMVLATQGHTQDVSTAPEKVNQLIQLLQDPDVQSMLKAEKGALPQTKETSAQAKTLATWELSLRRRIESVVAAVPRFPAEVWAAAMKVRADAISHGYAPVFVIFAGLIAVSMVAERVYLARRPTSDGPVTALTPIMVFAATMAIVFFAVEWPPLARIVLLAYLTAFIGYRFGAVIISLAARRSLQHRLKLLLGTIAFGVASHAIGPLLGVHANVTQAISIFFSILILLLCIESVWSTFEFSRPRRIVTTAILTAAWLLWCLSLKTLFWLVIYALILPGLLRAAERVARAFSTQSLGSMREVLTIRSARAFVIVLAVRWLAVVWQVNPDSLGHRDPTVTAIFYGLMKSVVILLLADLAWQAGKSWIDRTLVASANEAGLPPADAAKRARFRTLLPILRNALGVFVIVIATLIVLSELGVEIGPLIAGAGIFGVALGFGSQTLVKDVISGVFYMLDDAFRVGEYIQAKNYKGTVEGFSLRSVRLRHHRGPVFTVPFGELGAVENMSRDWGVVKFRISVGYDTDLEKARKLTKKIGTTLLDDPELGQLFIEPLKMKGLEEFGDYGLVLSFGMTLKPSPMQSFIRRRANLLLREAFTENGIEFATPSVQVGGSDGNGQEAAAAASALRAENAKTTITQA